MRSPGSGRRPVRAPPRTQEQRPVKTGPGDEGRHPVSCRLQGFDPLERPYLTPGVEAGDGRCSRDVCAPSGSLTHQPSVCMSSVRRTGHDAPRKNPLAVVNLQATATAWFGARPLDCSLPSCSYQLDLPSNTDESAPGGIDAVISERPKPLRANDIVGSSTSGCHGLACYVRPVSRSDEPS